MTIILPVAHLLITSVGIRAVVVVVVVLVGVILAGSNEDRAQNVHMVDILNFPWMLLTDPTLFLI